MLRCTAFLFWQSCNCCTIAYTQHKLDFISCMWDGPFTPGSHIPVCSAYAVHVRHMWVVQKQYGLYCKKLNFRKSSTNRFTFLFELNKNTLNMSLAKVVLFTLLKYYSSIRYTSICSQHIQMLSQLFKLNNLNKHFTLNNIAQVPSMHCLTGLIYAAASVVTVS